jgi:hypothetical protein
MRQEGNNESSAGAVQDGSISSGLFGKNIWEL